MRGSESSQKHHSSDRLLHIDHGRPLHLAQLCRPRLFDQEMGGHRGRRYQRDPVEMLAISCKEKSPDSLTIGPKVRQVPFSKDTIFWVLLGPTR